MEQPQEVVEDEEHERAWDRVAAVDVAKASGVVCTRVPDEDRPGRRRARVWTVAATMSEVTALEITCAARASRSSRSRAPRITGGSGTRSWRPAG